MAQNQKLSVMQSFVFNIFISRLSENSEGPQRLVVTDPKCLTLLTSQSQIYFYINKHEIDINIIYSILFRHIFQRTSIKINRRLRCNIIITNPSPRSEFKLLLCLNNLRAQPYRIFFRTTIIYYSYRDDDYSNVLIIAKLQATEKILQIWVIEY